MELKDNIGSLNYINDKYVELLSKIEILTIKDLITYFPFKYVDTTQITSIEELNQTNDIENIYQIEGKVSNFKNVFLRSKLTIQSALVTNGNASIKVSWFNQRYLVNVFKEGRDYIFSGKIKKTKNTVSFYPSFYEEVKTEKETTHLARITPEYYLTKGISKKWLRNRIKDLIDRIDNILIADEIGNQELKNSIKNIHFPANFESLEKSIKLLSEYEFTNIQLKILNSQIKRGKKIGATLDKAKSSLNLKNILAKIPFELTEDQNTVLSNLIRSLSSPKPLNALIQGDVGTGKTIIILILAYLFAKNSYQTVILAPTTILAKQHYENFKKILDFEKLNIQLITGQTKDNISNSDILIGTSAVLARKENIIKNLGLIVVDEQHKFGVNQRDDLLAPLKASIKETKIHPHYINMTATPIPRTIAQALFGDIEVEIISTKPIGRKPIKTHIVPEEKRESSYEWIANQVKKGDQVYWVCPLISDSEKIEAHSAETIFDELSRSDKLNNVRIKLLHGRMKDSDKTKILEEFSNHEFDILVSTSVIEVGIDISNVTTMVIENAERFGLAQLHQIRGRVGRGLKDSYCLIFYSEKLSKVGLDRLKYLSENDNGLKIAEFDMKNRGPGEIYGFRQSGIPKLKIANFADLDLIKQTRTTALKLYKKGIRKIALFEN